MIFNVLDTEATYRRLLECGDAAEREAIYRAELAEPFAGLARRFGMPDVMAAFRMWAMRPELFDDAHREKTRATLDALKAGDAWAAAAEALARGRDAFAAYADRIPLGEVTFGLMLGDLSGAPGNQTYTGFGGIPGWIMTVYGEADAYNVAHVGPTTAHELHHNVYGTLMTKNFMTDVTVGDYIIMEGLAETFATELYGEDLVSFVVRDFDMSRLDDAKRVMRDGLTVTGFDRIRGYVFGGPMAGQHGIEAVDLPLFAGYAIGYGVVQAYLKRTGMRVADATFVPSEEIIAESGYFD
jgi:uncharacterized protein YjaZ